jgi:predicted enzyme related to lactoylglutathione lyase
MNPGNISWHELLTEDVDGAKTFYGDLFGWDFEEHGRSTEYWVFNDGKKEAGGIMKRPEGMPANSAWSLFVTVENLDSTLATVRSLGGKVIEDDIEVEDVGTVGVIEDPQGAFVHVIEYDDASPSAPGEGTPGIDGKDSGPLNGQFCWYTLVTPDVNGAKNFYQSVFDWEFVEPPSGGGDEAWTITNNGFPIAGIMASQSDDPVAPAWGVSIAVDDIENAVDRAKELGAEVTLGPTPSGKIGANAIITDAVGAKLSLFEADMEGMSEVMAQFVD